MTPSETLRAAAARLRALAAKATDGPWRWTGEMIDVVPTERGDCVTHWGDSDDPNSTGSPPISGDIDWIVAMSPVVAEPLARELEMHAGWLRTIEDLDGDRASMGHALAVERAEHMLAFARSILGGTDV